MGFHTEGGGDGLHAFPLHAQGDQFAFIIRQAHQERLIQVDKLYVRDEQDIRSLAVEIATLTRRQQRGKGMRLA